MLSATPEVAVACSQAAANPSCTFYSVKRLIGRDCSAVQDDARQVPALLHVHEASYTQMHACAVVPSLSAPYRPQATVQPRQADSRSCAQATNPMDPPVQVAYAVEADEDGAVRLACHAVEGGGLYPEEVQGSLAHAPLPVGVRVVGLRSAAGVQWKLLANLAGQARCTGSTWRPSAD